MKNERKIFYGTIAAVIGAVIILSILFGPPSTIFRNKLTYMSYPAGAYTYVGEIEISDDLDIPTITSVPHLNLVHKNFDYKEVKQIAEKFGMSNLKINDLQDSYQVSSPNATLIVYKNGYKIIYTKFDVEVASVDLSDDYLIEKANAYLEIYKEYLPKEVNIKVYDVIEDRYEETSDDNGTSVETYYTKDVIYDCYYKEYFVGLILKVELDHKGNLVGFQTMPVEITASNYYINIKSFNEVHKWMEKGLPVPVSPKLIKSVTITGVMFGYLPTPTMFGAELKPAYIVNIHIEGIVPEADCDYTVDIGGIEE